MNRFYSRDTMTLDPDGQYVLYTDAQKYVDDSNVKSANLQLLVDKVLVWEVRDSSFQLAPEVEPQFNELIELARGLKQ